MAQGLEGVEYVIYKLVFFGKLSDVFGVTEKELITDKAFTTLDEVIEFLAKETPAFVSMLETDRIRFAVGDVIVEKDHRLQPGDEIAFLPPVSGG